MSKVHYTTLAAARLADPVKFDETLRKVITLAVSEVGHDVLLRAMRLPVQNEQQLTKLFAAA